jgi:hypothetical protein
MKYKKIVYFILALFILVTMNKSYGFAQSIAGRKIEKLY